MSREYSYYIRFSGITIRFILPTSLTLPECITELLCSDCNHADAEYRVTLITEPLSPQNPPVFTDGDSKIYRLTQGRLRIYSPLTDENGCQVACLLRSDKKNILYYPAQKWEQHRKYWHCAHLLWGEMLLMHFDAFLLHSSVVMINNKTVLFCGQSGAGKSTQAKLWEACKNAEIINGDRCVITNRQGVFYGGGSMWSGTSGIYNPKEAPIAGIFTLKKSKENSVRRLGIQAFSELYSQITLNTWDEEFMKKVTYNLQAMLCTIPVWELCCRPDSDAVELAYNTLFSKENSI